MRDIRQILHLESVSGLRVHNNLVPRRMRDPGNEVAHTSRLIVDQEPQLLALKINN